MTVKNRLKQLLCNKTNYFFFFCLCVCSLVEFLFTLPGTRNNTIIDYYNGFFGLYSVTFILIPLFLVFLISNDFLYENPMAILKFKNKKLFFLNRSITLLLDTMVFIISCLFIFIIFCIIFGIKELSLNFLSHLIITSVLHWLGLTLFSLLFYTARYIFMSRIAAFCITFGLMVIEFMSFTSLVPINFSIAINSSFIAGLLTESQTYKLALYHGVNIFLKLMILFCIGMFFIDNLELKGNYNEIK